MSKAQTKSTQLTTVESTEESPSYKRKRMKEVRAIVARAVANNKRVDLIGFEGTDIARSQIALQDLLSKEQEKHTRARGHIMNYKTGTDFLSDVLEMTVAGMDMMVSQTAAENQHLSAMLNNAHDECHRLACGWEETMKENYQIKTDNEGLKLALKATING